MILTDLKDYVGRNVRVYFTDGDVVTGKLEYAETFSEQYGWRKAKHFYIGDLCFRAWHVRKVEEA